MTPPFFPRDHRHTVKLPEVPYTPGAFLLSRLLSAWREMENGSKTVPVVRRARDPLDIIYGQSAGANVTARPRVTTLEGITAAN